MRVAAVAAAVLAVCCAGALAQTTPKGGDADAARLVNPVPVTAASLAKGKALYAAKCAACHGPEGTGGEGHGEGGPSPSDLTRARLDHGSSDGELFAVVKNGVLPDLYMPLFEGELAEPDMWHVVNYVQSLRKQ
jgi:mono/diheme cytochrome c family protein